MGNASGRPTESQALALEVTSIVVSFFSMAGSLYILQHILRDPQRRKATLTQIILGMSAMDFLYALVSSASTTIAPEEAVGDKSPLARGTWATCEAFGFLGHGSSLSSAIYNASLTLHYLLTIRYGWSEQRLKKLLIPMHLVPLLIGWGMAIPGVPLDLYNPSPRGCSLSRFPPGCNRGGGPPGGGPPGVESSIISNSTTTRRLQPPGGGDGPPPSSGCARGGNLDGYRIGFLNIWIWAVFIFLVVSMTLIYMKLASVERRNRRWMTTSSSAANSRSDGAAKSAEDNAKMNDIPKPGEDSNPLNSVSSAEVSNDNANDDADSSEEQRNMISKSNSNEKQSDEHNKINNGGNSIDSQGAKGEELGDQPSEQPFALNPQQTMRKPSFLFPKRRRSYGTSMASSRQSRGNDISTMQRLKNDFAMQALLYCIAFLLTWFFQWLKFLLIERTEQPPFFPIMFLDAFSHSLSISVLIVSKHTKKDSGSSSAVPP